MLISEDSPNLHLGQQRSQEDRKELGKMLLNITIQGGEDTYISWSSLE